MSSVIVFMYSGQGSQYYQMGRSLFEENNIFRTAMLKADQLYQDMTGSSVLKILYADQNTLGLPFIETLVTHPAIFMIEYALTEVLFSLNIRPNLVLGSSLGEFAAMVTAGVLSFETALTTVIKKAQILQQYCPPGGMMAILHNVELFDTHAWLYENAELAAINFDSHFVIAASPDNLQFISTKLTEYKINYLPLPVSQAFHSSLIDQARTPFLRILENIVINQPIIPFFSCATGQTLATVKAEHFWELARLPLLFQQTILQLENSQPIIYLDLGPSGTLATFVKYNLTSETQSKPFSIISPYGSELINLQKVKDLKA